MISRSLTGPESAAVAAALADEPIPETERIRRSGLARRTYQAAIERALDGGWIAARTVPDPVSFGYPRARVAAFRSGALGSPPAPDLLSPSSRHAVFLRGSQITFALSFEPPGRPARPEGDNRPEAGVTIDADLEASPIGVYFDYGAAFSRLAGLSGAPGYPHALPAPPPAWHARRTPLPPALRRELAQALAPGGGFSSGPSAGGTSAASGRAALARALRRGWVGSRTFLDPTRVPAPGPRSLEQLVIVWGRRRAGGGGLLSRLLEECAAAPVLYVSDGSFTLLLLLTARGPSPPRERRAPVLGTVQEALEGVQVVRQPLRELQTLVHHRYEALLAPPVAGGS